MNKKHPEWKQEEIDFLIKNYPSTSAKYCASILNRNLYCTKFKILQLKLKTNKQGSIGLLNLLDNTCESFYWIGFLLADGSFNIKRGRNVIKLTSSPKDLEHLIYFANFIDKSHDKIKHYLVKSAFVSTPAKTCEITATHKQLVKDICSKFDIKNNKTYNPPDFSLWKNFSQENIISLFAGFIDGDGTIYHRHMADNPRIRIKIHSAWFDFLMFFKSTLENYFNIPTSNPRINRQGYVELNICKEQLLKDLKRFILNKKLPVITRKWDYIDLNRINKTFKINKS